MTKVFKYKGYDKSGASVTGKVEANRHEEVVSYLSNSNITPINIKAVNTFNLSKKISALFKKRFGKIEPHHMLNFYRQLKALDSVGLPITKSLNKLAMSATSSYLKDVLIAVSNDVAAGMSFSSALRKHPKIFPEIVANVIHVGENSGRLGEVLEYLSGYMESTIANKRRLYNATRYPIFVLISVFVALTVLNMFVIPKFADIFSQFDLDLPFATKILIGVSNFMIQNKILLLVLMIVMALGAKRLIKIPKLSYYWDKCKLHFPIFGDLQRRIILSQFTWTFSLILRSGVPIIKGIRLASGTIKNSYFGKQLLKMRSTIERGESLTRASISSNLFTQTTIQMIEIGEESERLDEVLADVAKYYDDEIDYDLKRVGELIEPILLAFMGGMVAMLALGIYLPLWDLTKIAQS